MSAPGISDGPLVAEIGDELAFGGKLLHIAAQHVPLGVVEPDVVFGVCHVVETRVIARPAHEAVRRADTLGETGVTVRIAPVDTPFGIALGQNRITVTDYGAVLASDLESMHARLGNFHAVHQGDRLSTPGDVLHMLVAIQHLPGRQISGRAIVVDVLGAYRERELLSDGDHRWREAPHACDPGASHTDGLYGKCVEVPPRFEGNVQRQRHAIARKVGHQQTAAALVSITVRDGDDISRE